VKKKNEEVAKKKKAKKGNERRREVKGETGVLLLFSFRDFFFWSRERRVFPGKKA